MQVTFVGHASVLVEANDITILSDPWWEGPCFGTQWWVYPFAQTDVLKDKKIDYIYISHGHHDHLHLGTLRRLPKGATLLVSDDLDIGDDLESQGFKVKKISRNEEVDLGNDVKCRIIQTYADDTLMTISAGSDVLVNLNDALHACPESIQKSVCQMLRSYYPKIDYVFCGYGIASHFPCCYIVPGMDRSETAARRQAHFNRQWINIVNLLQPKYAFPFAADVVFLEEDLIWANEPIHNSQRPTDLFRQMYPDSKTNAIDIAPGFSIDRDNIKNNKLFQPLSIEKIKKDYAAEYKVANRTSKNSEEGLDALIELIRENIDTSIKYYTEYDQDYRFLVKLRGLETGISIDKKGKKIDVKAANADSLAENAYDVILTTRYSYLRRSLTNKYGDEVLYVGSGCLIAYTDADKIETGMHQELRTMLKKQDTPLKSRYGDQSKLLYKLKTFVKSLLGYKKDDLYSLKTWIVLHKNS